jgi:hypothetical protein
MYYIYHIPDIKIGCTDNVERRVEQQGYTNFEILEQYSDIYKASNRELALQKKYKYQIDKIPYFKSVEQWGAKAGKKGGKNAQKTLKELSLGVYSKDTKLRKVWSKLGNDAIKNKYGKDYHSKIAKLSPSAENGIESCGIKINKLDLSGNKIKSYRSLSEAARDNNISYQAINSCLKGITKTSAGFKWEYQTYN